MFYLLNNIQNKEILEFSQKIDDNNKDEFISLLVNFSISHGIQGDLWKGYILYTLIFNDTPYTRSIERKKNIKWVELAKKDLMQYYTLYTQELNIKEIKDFIYESKGSILNFEIQKLESEIQSYTSFESSILSFYQNKGLSDMALYKAFRVKDGDILPISHVQNVGFTDLIGYDEQKKLLIENTEHFLNHKPYNNVLLYGDSGTGKSTSIKALLNTYASMGLRIIEVYKHQMEEISKAIYSLKDRPYFYIIYMDDLSFEENEIEYKYLKSIIEGGIEEKPDNVAIYATSNRRHLIKETFKDNQTDDLHRNETQAEKLSLAYRFGLQIFYSSLSPKEFKTMVLTLAKKNKLQVEEELLLKEASKWELTYGSLSGRCATQFMAYMINKYKK